MSETDPKPESTPARASASSRPAAATGTTPFAALSDYVSLPRIAGLAMSTDGRRLVVGVSVPNPKGTKYQQSLWDIDPDGVQPARRLTRGATGESSATFTSAGDLLFTAKRVDPQAESPDDEADPLWRLRPGGGEAELLAQRRGGFDGLKAARSGPVLAVTASVLAGNDLKSDDDGRKARQDADVSAILHDGYPIRFWDHDLGPDWPHLAVADLADEAETAGVRNPAVDFRDLTPQAGLALVEAAFDLSADGSFLVTGWNRRGPGPQSRSVLVRIDTATGAQSELLSDPDAELSAPVISPDGRCVVFSHETLGSPQDAARMELRALDLAEGTVRTLGGGWDRRPTGAAFLPDSATVLVTADDDGRSPIWRIPLDGGPAAKVTDDDYAYSNLQVHPDGAVAFALRSSYAAPPHPVRVDLADGSATALPGPVPLPELPGRLEEVRTSAADGHPVRAWLALPAEAGPDRPAPLLLWIHGGPVSSWNAWSWRWNPWLMVAQGYAVLLPDPALSTGYGHDFIQRGWGAWGGNAFTDLMAVTDAVETRADIDATRTAAMGGSFGGYMANWVAGHTERFSAIVTHASLWALDEFGGTTDAGYYWDREMSPEMMLTNSPHLSVDQITTPMLVVHGDKDYRVPIGQGLRLWYDLLSKSGRPADENGRTVHRFLYFPSENHWVLTPQHAELWYRVVLDFLAEHVLGAAPAPLPRLLGGPKVG